VPLFDSNAQFESGCGWPSFSTPINDKEVDIQSDLSLGMKREEVLCNKCGGHLGHVGHTSVIRGIVSHFPM